MNTTSTPIHEADWARALDEHLRDQDALQDYLCGHMRYHSPVSESGVRALAGQLAMRAPLRAQPPYSIGELLYVLLTETPDIAIAARAELRDRILTAHSNEVSRLYWKAQDAERESAVMEFDDASEFVK
jgi:hypothetical protein